MFTGGKDLSESKGKNVSIMFKNPLIIISTLNTKSPLTIIRFARLMLEVGVVRVSLFTLISSGVQQEVNTNPIIHKSIPFQIRMVLAF